MFAALIVLAGGAWPHPESMSSSRVVVEDNAARVLLRCQVASWLEAFPDFDRNGDADLDAAELEACAPSMSDYVRRHYRLTANVEGDGQGGALLGSSLIGVQATPMQAAVDGRLAGRTLDLDLSYVGKLEIRRLMLEVSLFAESSPDHVDIASVVWSNGASQTFALDRDAPRAISEARPPSVWRVFFELGLRHIAGGFDHLAFVCALVLASERLRSLLGLVTAFTLAHSLTLGLSTLGIVDTGRYSATIEATIALSIAYVALETAWMPDQKRTRWPEALLFGLVHGLGFAGFLSESLLAQTSRAPALLAFNAGVEVGQLALVLALVAVLFTLRRLRPWTDDFLAPRWLRRGGSLAIGVLGLYWFAQRV